MILEIHFPHDTTCSYTAGCIARKSKLSRNYEHITQRLVQTTSSTSKVVCCPKINKSEKLKMEELQAVLSLCVQDIEELASSHKNKYMGKLVTV